MIPTGLKVGSIFEDGKRTYKVTATDGQNYLSVAVNKPLPEPKKPDAEKEKNK